MPMRPGRRSVVGRVVDVVDDDVLDVLVLVEVVGWA
jgi:hypothetical protein